MPDNYLSFFCRSRFFTDQSPTLVVPAKDSLKSHRPNISLVVMQPDGMDLQGFFMAGGFQYLSGCPAPCFQGLSE